MCFYRNLKLKFKVHFSLSSLLLHFTLLSSFKNLSFLQAFINCIKLRIFQGIYNGMYLREYNSTMGLKIPLRATSSSLKLLLKIDLDTYNFVDDAYIYKGTYLILTFSGVITRREQLHSICLRLYGRHPEIWS